MQHKPTIAAIILTYNEEIHVERCLRSLQPFCQELWVVDSYSTDHTKEIACEFGAHFVEHKFVNQAQQFNWAIENCPINADWIWRVDADEYISTDLGRKVVDAMERCSDEINGIYVNKRIVFLGRPLLHGGWYPAQQIKIIRKGFGRCENKVMDEHLIVTSGKTIRIDGDQTDENLNDLTWWTHKHNSYATREVINMLQMRYGLDKKVGVRPRLFGNDAERKRWLKLKYIKAPLFVRPFVNFFYRYVLKCGFLDGKEGFAWHILQGFWYRMLVDVKIFELRKRFCHDDEKIKAFIRERYNL